MNGCKIAHGTPFYRAVEEGLVNPHKVVQIGIRGPGWSTDDTLWGMQQVFLLFDVLSSDITQLMINGSLLMELLLGELKLISKTSYSLLARK